MKPTVIILGAAGFIGSALRRRFRDRWRLLSVDNRPIPTGDDFPSEGEERRLRCDLGEPAEIDALLDAIEPEASSVVGVVHLAAYYDFNNRPDPRYTAIEEGLAHLLQRLPDTLPNEACFVYASSMAAMAPTNPGEPQTPESPRSGAWAYPAHKLRAERLIESADTPQPRVELVLAGVYSEWCELVPLFHQIERVRSGSPQSLFYPGPVDRGLTYVHVEDAADAFGRAVERLPGREGVIRLLIGEPEPVTYKEIQSTAAEHIHGQGASIVRVPRFLAKGGARLLNGLGRWTGDRGFVKPWMVDFAGEHFEFDLSATQSELDWRPQHRLHHALGDICDQARARPDEWVERNLARPGAASQADQSQN